MNDNGFPRGAVLVFGGSGGIGQGVALEFARAGVPVAVGYRSKADVAERVARDIRGEGVAATTHCVDVTEPAQVDAALAAAIDAHGRVHTVVWAAGPFVNQRHIGDMTHDDWRRAIEVETIGFFVAAKAALLHFRASGGGSFVTLGSAGHLRWPERDGLSVAPKAANEALVKGLAREEGRYNIRANSILVGVIEAGMFPVLLEQGQFDQVWIDETQKMLALKRWGKAHDVGRAAVFLASDRADYVTGQQLNVSGGMGCSRCENARSDERAAQSLEVRQLSWAETSPVCAIFVSIRFWYEYHDVRHSLSRQFFSRKFHCLRVRSANAFLSMTASFACWYVVARSRSAAARSAS